MEYKNYKRETLPKLFIRANAKQREIDWEILVRATIRNGMCLRL